MTDIKWGPAIAVDGKRPGFVADGVQPIMLHNQMGWHHWNAERVDPAKVGWAHPSGGVNVDQIKLPADHPHYRQTEAAPIDWSGELEAVHEDGRTIAMKVAQLNAGAYGRNDHWLATADGSRFPSGPGSTHSEWARKDGDLPNAPGWRIRNVPQPTPQADTKPDLTARMEAVMREYARGCNDLIKRADGVHRTTFSEAQAIVALLPEPVDPDLIEARKLVAERTGRLQIECGYSRSVLDGEQDDHPAVINTLAAIKRGRALALAGEKEA